MKNQPFDYPPIAAAASPAQSPITLTSVVNITAAAAGADGTPAGPPTFNMTAYTGGAMRLKGWQYPVVVDMQGIQGMDRNRPALKDHDPGKVVGHTTSVGVEGGSLMASGVISGYGPHVDEVVNAGKSGFPWQASIGSRVIENEFVPKGQTAQANGQTFEGPVNIARRTSLGEISFVALGADDNTSARIAAEAAEGTPMNFEQWLEAKGFTLAGLNDAQKTSLQAMYDAEHTAADPATATATAPEPTVQATSAPATVTAAAPTLDLAAIRAQAADETRKAIRSEQASETKRIGDLRKICAGRHADIEAKAIEQGWDAQHTELEVLRAERPQANATPNGSFGINVGAGVNADEAPAVLASAAALSAGIRPDVALKDLSDQGKQIAVSKQYRGISLHNIMAMVAPALGIAPPRGSITDDYLGRFLRAERSMDIRAGDAVGFSTMSLSGITENILNKAMLQAYGDVPSVVGDVCFETDTNDFKQFKRYRMTASGSMAQVGPSGELKSFSLQDESYANQVKTQGMILTIGRDILINDDMGALAQIPTVIGREAALYRELQVFTTLTGNAGSFFGTTNKNNLTGAGSVLAIAGLTSAVQKFREQKDANNRPIMVSPDRLLVPPALEATALNLFNGANLVVSSLGSTAARVVEPNLNAHQGKYRPIVSPFLGAQSTITGLNDTAWYLLSNPTGGFATVQIGYLRGQRTPIIERGEVNFNTLGLALRCYYDFGVALHDSRCGVLNAGA